MDGQRAYSLQDTYLAQVKSIIHLVLERSHLHLADELRLEMSVPKDSRQQLIQMCNKQVHLVMYGRVQGGQCKPVIAQVTIAEHAGQQGNHQRSQDIVIGIARVGKCVAEG